ncbi:MAG: MarR family transcriptional regulator, partial [Clostridia bacterium]|nr:MarR family transcriptional regulator [Clostridia bacterium]
MSQSKYDALKLENQLCFPLYAAAREVVKRYRPYLDELDLTYTQYITMMVMWEQKEITVKALGDKLFLDSGTMTPVLKSLEANGYVVRKRSTSDERSVTVILTDI